MADATIVEVGGRQLRLTNLDKVLYPETGTTKAEVIDYYARIAPAMVPHVAGRPLTFRRWPNGVEQSAFFEKNCPGHAPDWVPRLDGPGDVRSCGLDDQAALAWAGNQAALEIHAPMSRAGALDEPLALVLDLDPGPPADIVTCVEVAVAIRAVLDTVDLVSVPKTSGSKGMQLYVPLNGGADYETTSSFALALGQLLERQRPELVLTDMTRSLRPGKVLIDWSQNSFHKTTIAPYSLRGRARPTVSTPVTWDELEAATSADDLTFEAADVLARVEHHGDLFADVVELEQRLPQRGGG
ncbi:MAG: non-homologous end-joining DNA ligase [Actinomycetota bacterium]